MLTIRTIGNRARLIGDVPQSLESDLRSKFSWVSPTDLTSEILFYCDRVMYSGIVAEVRDFIRDRGIECDIEFPDIEGGHDWRMTRSYRPLQEDVVNALYSARYAMGQAPPGTGKTTVAAGLLCKVGQAPAFVVTPNERPFTQAYRTIAENTNIPVGRYGGKFKELTPDGVTVCTIQTLFKQLVDNPNSALVRAWEQAQIVIVDEAHHAASDTHVEVFDLLKSVKFFIGLSATPWRDDDRGDWLQPVIGNIVYKISRAQAIDHGLSVPLSVFVEDMAPKSYGWVQMKRDDPDAYYRAMRPRKRKEGDLAPFDAVYQDYVVNNVERNRKAIDFCLRAMREAQLSCCFSVSKIPHIDALQALEPSIVSLHGTTKNRDEYFDRMQSKEQMLTASTLMDEAVDVSSLSVVAMLAGGKSTVKLEQRIRCDRRFDGMTVHGFFAKDRGYVYIPRDHCDFLSSHSTDNVKLLKEICDEHDDHEFWLNGHLIKRGKRVPKYKPAATK